MAEKLIGSYKFEKNENFEEFLIATEIPMIQRKVMASTSPNIEIKNEGSKWTITIKVLLKTNVISFELGKEFEEENPILGEKNKIVAEMVEGKLILKVKHEKTGLNAKRSFIPTDEGLMMMLQADGKEVVAKRYFKRAE